MNTEIGDQPLEQRKLLALGNWVKKQFLVTQYDVLMRQREPGHFKGMVIRTPIWILESRALIWSANSHTLFQLMEIILRVK